MQRVNLLPSQYHELRFDPALLPDVAAAGPVSASILSKSRDPLSFLLSAPNGDKSTAAMEWGNLIDTLWTQAGQFDQIYIVLPEDAPQRPTQAMLDAKTSSPASVERQRWWKDFDARAEGKQTVSAADYDAAKSALAMLNANSLAREIWEASDKQVALYGNNPIMPGTKAKCLFDLLPLTGPFNDCIADLKSTNDTSEHGLEKTMRTFDYTVKLSFYGILAEAAGFGPRKRGILIWQKSSWPYDVHVREIDPVDMEIGRQVAINRCNALAKLDRRHLDRHYDTSLKISSLPDFARTAMLNG